MTRKIKFKVLYATSQDDDHRVIQLNEHSVSTKGWMSERFCTYPQEIILELEYQTRIRKIQILSHECFIASEVEFYVGVAPADRLSDVQYKRIGYIELSSNEKTNYQSRELKSVHIDVIASHIRYIIHKNHVYPLNFFNQVGIVAINILGDDIFEEQKFPLNNNRDQSTSLILPPLSNRQDNIQSTDDLAFDLYQDPEVAKVIRKMEKKKQIAVQQEHFELAKKLKSVMIELHQLGIKLTKYEMEKNEAVEKEDFDLAAMKKIKADGTRNQVYEILQRNDLFDLAKSPMPPVSLSHSSTPQKINSSRDIFAAQIIGENEPVTTRKLPVDKLPLKNREENTEPFEEETDYSDISKQVKKDQKTTENKDPTYLLLEEAFDSDMARFALSKEYSERLKAIKDIHYEMQELKPPNDKASVMLRASALLINATMRDVPNMARAGLDLLRLILTSFISKQKISRSESINFIENFLPVLIAKTEYPVRSQRDSIKDFIVEMSQFNSVKPLHVVSRQCTIPITSNESARLSLSRTELIDMLYKVHGLNNGFNLDNMMTYLSVALTHASGDVRKKAESVIVALYKDIGNSVRNYLPEDGKQTRKNILYRHLFEEFDKIDRKTRQKVESSKKVDDKKTFVDKQPAIVKPASNLNEHSDDKRCIFCDEYNDSFTEDGLNLHFWKTCPMLMACPYCSDTVETSDLKSHLINCKKKDSFSYCPRCNEAIPNKTYTVHIRKLKCEPANKTMDRCPHCHKNFKEGTSSSVSWKRHLMETCKSNPRKAGCRMI